MTDIFNFIKDNNLPIILFIGLIVAVLYLMKKLIDAGIAKDLKNFEHENSEKINKLQSALDKQKQQLDHMHQVSQPTYQHLFEKKIDVYQKLIQIQTKYSEEYKEKSILQEVVDIHFTEVIKLYIEELNSIEDIIKDKKLFISNELLEIYEELMLEKEKFNSEFAELALTIYHKEIDDPYDEYGKDEIYTKIYKKTKPLFSKFDSVLDSDILKIKKKINLD